MTVNVNATVPPQAVLVCGSRTWTDADMLFGILDNRCPDAARIIHGGATGADRCAGDWARRNQRMVTVFPANWRKHGKRAGYLRNQQMLDEGKPDLVLAFVDKPLAESKGTAMMVQLALNAGVPTAVYESLQ